MAGAVRCFAKPNKKCGAVSAPNVRNQKIASGRTEMTDPVSRHWADYGELGQARKRPFDDLASVAIVFISAPVALMLGK